MNNVDIVDGRIAESIAEEVPTMSRAKTSQQMADDLSFSEFGLRRDYLHPGFQRAEFRKGESGISESQPAAYTEILNMSNRIDRFMDAVSKTKNADNSLATYADIVRTDMVKFNRDLAKAMAKSYDLPDVIEVSPGRDLQPDQVCRNRSINVVGNGHPARRDG